MDNYSNYHIDDLPHEELTDAQMQAMYAYFNNEHELDTWDLEEYELTREEEN